MIAHRRIWAAALVLGVMGYAILFAGRDAARAADVDASKLVGKWVFTNVVGVGKGGGGDIVQYQAYEFTQKGAMTRTVGRDSYKGTYKVKGDKLTLRFSAPRAKSVVTEIMTIKKLEDDVLVIVPEKPKLELEFKKEKKEKK
ncbi:MAG TPA: lipocalin family protein [Gemmataceae bacterium]|jgi:uncharacterized protein (TIGR03066 family)